MILLFFVKPFKTENKQSSPHGNVVGMLYGVLAVLEAATHYVADKAKKVAKQAAAVCCRLVLKVKPLAAKAAKTSLDFASLHATELIGRLHSSRLRAVLAAGTVAAAVAVIVTANAANYTAGVAVKLDGKTVGYVVDEEAAADVENTVQEKIYGNKMGLMTIEYEETLVKRNKLSDDNEVADSVLNSIGGIKRRSALTVDGEIMAVADDRDTLEQALASLVEYYTGDDFEFIGYENDLSIIDIYVTADSTDGIADSAEDILAGKAGISVLTARVENEYDVELPYDTVVTYDDSHTSSYSKVKSKGQNGSGFVSERVYYCNGKRVNSGVIYSEIINAPVNEEVVKGICEESVTTTVGGYVPAAKAIGGKGSMIFPCAVTSRTYISSFWGDGRGHRGVDIASPYGSDIYAAMDGVVTFSGTKGAYGKCIIVKHSDGLETLYSHNSRNLVKAGEIVTAGQVIAKVGATGNATGNHLHFSVMLNGEMVNPAPYIGLSGGSKTSSVTASADTGKTEKTEAAAPAADDSNQDEPSGTDSKAEVEEPAAEPAEKENTDPGKTDTGSDDTGDKNKEGSEKSVEAESDKSDSPSDSDTKSE